MQMQRMSIIDDIKRFILALALAAIFSAPVGAATLTVTKTVDTGDGVCDTDCSLREAIWVASAGDTINFAPSLNSQTITLVNTIPLDKNLTIQGPGLSLLTILNNASYTIAFVTNGTGITVTFDGVTLRGTSTNGLLHNKSSDTVTFTNSVLSDCGKVDSGANGGAVWNEGTLTLASSTVSNNAANRAGAILNDGMLTITNSHLENNTANTNGAILNRSTLTIQDSILTGNQTSEYGGAIHNDGGSLTITDSTLSNNAAPFGGGILTGNDGTVTISNSTLSNNNATYDGGAILIFAGTVTVTNSTFSGNTANNGGGIANSGTLTVTNSTVSGNTAGIEGGGIASDGAITVRQSTFTGNSAAAGGGIASHTLTIGNSLIAGNTATTGREINVKVSWSSQGYNLIGFSSSTGMSGSGNPTLTATDFTPTVGLGQIIGALIDNGGPTQTHALVTGSPAINAGSDALATAAGLSTDQRGQPRFSGTVDIGSYEVQSAVVNGACGASAGQTFTSAPSSNLCTAGSPSSVTTNPGTFTWNCTGSGGGSTASCSATRAFTVTPSASTQGSINPNTAVTVAYNATRAFTVTPNTGYTASVSGCNGGLTEIGSAT
ncbi:MAG: CSLREA domain-containing protein, partial [Candidatus Competibacteraceae bacterium]|nr:CSLREA domain-containing protein [Candidatus Competibacteraceae bacterium]